MKVENQKIVHAGRFSIICEQVDFGKGVSPFSYVNMKPGICVIPIVNQTDIVVLREYRHAIKKYELEFPCGIIDKGETPEQAAIRELKEETGYSASSILSLGYFYPSFGATNEKIYLFAANCSEDDNSPPKHESSELIETELKPISEVEKLISSGEFTCAGCIIAWYRWKDNFSAKSSEA